MAGVNSCFAEVTENDILRMQDITIPNDTKKATKLGMIVLRDKQCWGGSRGGSVGSVEPPKVKREYFYHTFSCEKRTC